MPAFDGRRLCSRDSDLVAAAWQLREQRRKPSGLPERSESIFGAGHLKWPTCRPYGARSTDRFALLVPSLWRNSLTSAIPWTGVGMQIFGAQMSLGINP